MATVILLQLLLLGSAIAFNNDDNEHGYTGRCPPDWREIDQLCFKKKDHERDFREALKECTSDRDNYHTYWEQGARWVGPKYNLMPVEHLPKLLEHWNSPDEKSHHLGHGPYRVNAIKTSYDHKWREYDGGDPDIDVYRWRGGREIDFSQFPEFDEEWGHPGDTLVWYPSRNKLYSRPHYHKYDSLCYRRKEDAERCPGIPECNYNGDCYHGKCYCYKGYVGDDCCCKPKILIAGGGFMKKGSSYAELFDFETMTSCVHSVLPEEFRSGEMEMVNGEVFHCGGGHYNFSGATNASECWLWSRKDQEWIQRDIGTMTKPHRDFDSVIVPGLGWWLISGTTNNDTTQTEKDITTYFMLEDDRSALVDGPELKDWNTTTAQNFCAVQFQHYFTAIIGGEGQGSVNEAQEHYNDTAIFDWYRNEWVRRKVNPGGDAGQGWWKHECEVLIDPSCGHEVVAIVGGASQSTTSTDAPTEVMLWDTYTDEYRSADTFPCNDGDKEWYDMESVKIDDETMVLLGGICGSGNAGGTKEIYTYSIGGGFTQIGEMLMDRHRHSAVVVWGDDFKCPDTPIVPGTHGQVHNAGGGPAR